jgi:tetratricopeptide (TPR) repeat protein
MFATLRAMTVAVSMAAAALAYGPVHAQTTGASEAEKRCEGRGNVPDEVQIAACTQIINDASKYSAARLNDVYFYRGLTYAQTGRCALAIPDFTAAIKHDPKDADAYWSRFICKFELGDKEGAAADKKTAKTLDPRIEEQWTQ